MLERKWQVQNTLRECHQRQQGNPCAFALVSVFHQLCTRYKLYLIAMLMRVLMTTCFQEKMSPETIGEPLCLRSFLEVSMTSHSFWTRPPCNTDGDANDYLLSRKYVTRDNSRALVLVLAPQCLCDNSLQCWSALLDRMSPDKAEEPLCLCACLRCL